MAFISNMKFLHIFYEAEIASFDEDFIDSLKALLDDKLSLAVLDFIESINKSSLKERREEVPFVDLIYTKVEMMEERLGDVLLKNTFHIEAKKRDIVRTIFNTNYMTVLTDTSINRKKLLEDVTWLIEHRSRWQHEIKPRDRNAYELFLMECERISQMARSLHMTAKIQLGLELERNELLMESLKANKGLFYVKEQARSTGLSGIIREAVEIEKLKHCLEYNEICDRKNISIMSRYSLGGLKL